MTYTRYYNLFNLSIQDLNTIIYTALEDGGDYADIFCEYSTSNNLNLTDHKVNSLNTDIDFGVGIRVLAGENTGYAFSESTDMKDLINAAKMAAKIATIRSYKTPLSIPPTSYPKILDLYPQQQLWEDLSFVKRKNLLVALDQLINESDQRVTKVMASISDSNTKVMFYNSLGEHYCDERPLFSLRSSCVMEEGSKRETYGVSKSFRSGAELILDNAGQALIKEIATEIIQGASTLFKATQPKGGQMQVVMGSGSSGILLHEAIGHTFEADFCKKRTSIFSDMMGKKICNEKINIVDDGTLRNNRGAINIDDEGVPSQCTYMVKDGILNSFLHDRLSAKHFNTQSTGNGRRESFRFNPIPRMRATYMESGDCLEADLIAEVKSGIYVDNFSNGQVQIGAGDFTFFVRSGYLIENGKLTQPIKDTNIIGNGPEALADILAVANNNKVDNSTWTCGKEQYCAVSCGMPSVLIKSLNVGGVE